MLLIVDPSNILASTFVVNYSLERSINTLLVEEYPVFNYKSTIEFLKTTILSIT